jgi:hypothetical protein
MSLPRPFDPDDLESLPVVQLMSAGPPIYEQQINRAWRGLVQAPGSVQPGFPAVLKFMPSNVKVSIELGCSLASAALKLPVPRGMLALADPSDLQGMPADAKSIPGRSEVLCYASMLQWPQDTMERVDKEDQAVADHLWNRFCHSNVASPGAAWDELVANPDRHARNFIFDGTRYWLIDHDLSLKPLAEAMREMTGQAGRQKILEHRASRNQVATQLLQRRPNDHGMLAQPRTFEARKRALETQVIAMSKWRTGIPSLDAVLQDAETVVRGIILRLPALALQLNERLEKPNGPLLWTPSTAS